MSAPNRARAYRGAEAGFTLLELCLAVAIILLLVMIAVPSVTGILSEQRLRRTYDAFDELAREAQTRAVTERRAYTFVWGKEAIEVLPVERVEDGENAPIGTISIGEHQKYVIQRTAALEKDPPPEWTFWRSGACEPATITYEGPEGTWSSRYDPLTGRGTLLTMAPH